MKRLTHGMSFESKLPYLAHVAVLYSIVAAFQSRFTFFVYKYTKRILVEIVVSFYTAFKA